MRLDTCSTQLFSVTSSKSPRLIQNYKNELPLIPWEKSKKVKFAKLIFKRFFFCKIIFFLQERLFAHLSKNSDGNYKLVAPVTLPGWWESIESFAVLTHAHNMTVH